jgi:hypothetical protein
VASNEFIGGGKEKAEYQRKGKVFHRIVAQKNARGLQLSPLGVTPTGAGGSHGDRFVVLALVRLAGSSRAHPKAFVKVWLVHIVIGVVTKR